MEIDVTNIEEAHPLKQGLKQALEAYKQAVASIEEAHPLKQGLKLSSPNWRS